MKLFAVAFVIVAALAVQRGEIPPYPGDSNPQHNGQPQWCQNVDGGGYAHNCDCMDMQDIECQRGEQETSRCKVYCRKTACKCKTMCDKQTIGEVK